MNSKLKNIAIAAVAMLAVSSCAKDKEESSNSVQERILQAWISENYPTARPTPLGSYLLTQTEGTGKQLGQKEAGAVYIDYSTKSLAGQYTYTSDAEIAKQLGSYSADTYYGPKLMEVGYGSTYSGLEELLRMMKEGGSLTAVVPPWLTVSEYGGSMQQESVSVIYQIQLRHVITNIQDFQRDTLQAFSNKYYDGIDSLAEGFYFKKLYDSGNDTIEQSDYANVWYVGKLLDGWVFDTNIADTAKKYGLYNASTTYDPLIVSYGTTWSDMKESNGLVGGFCRALKNMTYEDKAVTFFWSTLGYGSDGSGEISAFQPLFFYLEIDKKDE